jgi:hypothetical protein
VQRGKIWVQATNNNNPVVSQLMMEIDNFHTADKLNVRLIVKPQLRYVTSL